MDLFDALKRVMRFCPTKKSDPEELKAVRFIPGAPGYHPRVFGTDGLTGCVVEVTDQALPSAVFGSDALKGILKGAVGIDSVEAVGYGEYRLSINTKTSLMGYTVASIQDTSRLPGLPPIPAIGNGWSEVPWFEDILGVVHASKNGMMGTDWANLYFTPDWVQASDQTRLARVAVKTPLTGHVPHQVFRTWPKGEVQVAVTHLNPVTPVVFFRIGDETRFTFMQPSRGEHEKLEGYLPGVHPGPGLVVAREGLMDLVKRAKMVTAMPDLISLDFGVRGVTVRATVDGHGAGFEASLDGVPTYYTGDARFERTQMILDAKVLVEILRSMDTPSVMLGFAAPQSMIPPHRPLRIESGPMLVCLFQTPFHRVDKDGNEQWSTDWNLSNFSRN